MFYEWPKKLHNCAAHFVPHRTMQHGKTFSSTRLDSTRLDSSRGNSPVPFPVPVPVPSPAPVQNQKTRWVGKGIRNWIRKRSRVWGYPPTPNQVQRQCNPNFDDSKPKRINFSSSNVLGYSIDHSLSWRTVRVPTVYDLHLLYFSHQSHSLCLQKETEIK